MNPRVVFIQSIFCPCDELFELNKNSLISLLKYLTANPYRIDIRLAGWCIEDKYWDELIEISKNK